MYNGGPCVNELGEGYQDFVFKSRLLIYSTASCNKSFPPPKKKKITCIMIILLWEYTKCLHNTCIFLFFYFNIGFVTDILSLPNFQNIKPFFIFMNLWNNEAFFIFGLTKLWNKEPYLILDQRAFGIMNHISVLN